jgi:hypothetical protein
MKELPDDKTLLEILELAKDFEQSARRIMLSLYRDRLEIPIFPMRSR